MKTSPPKQLIANLVSVGYRQTVAEKIVEHRPDLAENPTPPVLAYHGHSGGPETFDPHGDGSKTVVVLVEERNQKEAIRKAQEYALGVIWGNTRPSPDGHYTVVEYQLPEVCIDRNGGSTVSGSIAPGPSTDEAIFVARVGEFHTRPQAPVSEIDWGDFSENSG